MIHIVFEVMTAFIHRLVLFNVGLLEEMVGVLEVERWEFGQVVVLWDLCQDKLHLGLLAEALADPLVLQQLKIANKVLATALRLQNEVETWQCFEEASALFVDLFDDVLNELAG